jgi:hypothetical protein
VKVPGLREERITEVVQAIRELAAGGTNAGGEFTLAASVTSTTVPCLLCSPRSQVLLTAKTASAASATGVYVTPGTRQFVVNHNSTSATDRTYSYLVLNTD